MRDLVQDVRYAFRQLTRSRGFSAVAILTLALGLGANAALFSLVDAVVFRPAAARWFDGVSIVTLIDTHKTSRSLEVTDFRTLESNLTTRVTAVAGVWWQGPRLVQTSGRADFVLGEAITPGYAAVFGLSAQAGRWISAEDDRGTGADVAVISDRLWREWYGADRSAVGREVIRIGRRPYTIIGVAPPGFRGAQGGPVSAEVWVPMGHPLPSLAVQTARIGQRLPRVRTFVSSAADVTAAQLADEVRRALGDRPDEVELVSSTVRLTPAREALRTDQLVTSGLVVLAFSTLVLLAACANLANMLYARGVERRDEIAVRLSLGASRSRILRLLLIEIGIVGAAAATLGLVIAVAATEMFSWAFPTFQLYQNLRVTLDLSPDYGVFLDTFVAGVFVAAMVGLAISWRASQVHPSRALASSRSASVVSARSQGIRTGLVSIQVTTAVILTMSASAFVDNTSRALPRHVLFDTSGLTAARITLLDEYNNEAASRAYVDRVLRAAAAIPGVERVSVADALPGGTRPAPHTGVSAFVGEEAKIRSGKPVRLDGSWIYVTPGFLETMGLPLRRGRAVIASDVDTHAAVAVVSDSVAERLWPGQEPLGQKLRCCGSSVWRTVVGIASSPFRSADDSPNRPSSNFVYLPLDPRYERDLLVIARSANAAILVEPLRTAIQAVDENVPVFETSTVDGLALSNVAFQRAARLLASTLGALALGIALLGIYGVVAYFVSRRTREFGLRLALGATPRQVLRIVIDYAIHVVLVGLLPGVFLASVGSRLFQNVAPTFMPSDISTWSAVPLLLLAAGIAAAYLPARRAARVDPNVALRDL